MSQPWDLGKAQSVDDNLRDACSGALFVINSLDKDLDAQQAKMVREA